MSLHCFFTQGQTNNERHKIMRIKTFAVMLAVVCGLASGAMAEDRQWYPRTPSVLKPLDASKRYLRLKGYAVINKRVDMTLNCAREELIYTSPGSSVQAPFLVLPFRTIRPMSAGDKLRKLCKNQGAK